MAARNKKGKIHGIFKSAFQVSFFHKPTMEETDIYYYIVLDDVIFIKMRLLYDIVLVIDEVTPLTMSYLSQEYNSLFNLLKDQTSVSVLVSLVGNTSAFGKTCRDHEAPIVEKEEFLDCSMMFYNKFKNYCRNDISRYGFYLISLREDTFSIIENAQKQNVITEESDVRTSVAETCPSMEEPTIKISTNSTDKMTEKDNPIKEETIPKWISAFLDIWNEYMGLDYEITRIKEGNYLLTTRNDTKLTLCQSPPIQAIVVGLSSIGLSTNEKMNLVSTLTNYGERNHVSIRVNGANPHDVVYNMLEDDDGWRRVGVNSFFF